MFDLGAFFFQYFEKILMVLFGAVLAFSIVLYGPWTYKGNFDSGLAEVARAFEDRPEIPVTVIPTVPDYLDRLDEAGVVAETLPLESPHFWHVLARAEGSAMVLPPSSVLAVGMRGYNRVNWEHNTNQPKEDGSFDFTGVEIQRAKAVDGAAGEFEVLTRNKGVDYFVPRQLYGNNARHRPIVERQEKQNKRVRSSSSGMTIADLFNAVYDNRLKIGDVAGIARDAVRQGVFATQDYYRVNSYLMEMQMEMMDLRRESRGLAAGKRISKEEALKDILARRGWKGGGKWGTAPAISKATEKEVAKTTKELVVRWGEIVAFYDSTVSPDLKYIYRARFWGKEQSDAGPLTRKSDWTFSGDAIASKSDTEFSLDGGMLEIGKPYIRVRKWIPEIDNWATRVYLVAVGEEIGRKELMEKRDRIGKPIRDASGKISKEEVDFSTKCVLLAFRQRPLAVDSFGVDKPESAQYPMLPGLQIVYSNRRGELQTKWETGSQRQ